MVTRPKPGDVAASKRRCCRERVSLGRNGMSATEILRRDKEARRRRCRGASQRSDDAPSVASRDRLKGVAEEIGAAAGVDRE